MTCEGKTLICVHCGERFCPDCDFPPGVKDVIGKAPIHCGVCLDINSATSSYADLILLRLENRQRRNEN